MANLSDGVATWFLLEGSVEVFSRDGFDDETSLRVLASGQFTGELNELANRPAQRRAVDAQTRKSPTTRVVTTHQLFPDEP
jgi:hypothetical protein